MLLFDRDDRLVLTADLGVDLPQDLHPYSCIPTLSDQVSIYLYIYLTCLPIYLSNMSTDLSIFLSIYLSIYLSLSLPKMSTDLSIYLSIYQSFQFIYPSLYLSHLLISSEYTFDF